MRERCGMVDASNMNNMNNNNDNILAVRYPTYLLHRGSPWAPPTSITAATADTTTTTGSRHHERRDSSGRLSQTPSSISMISSSSSAQFGQTRIAHARKLAHCVSNGSNSSGQIRDLSL